MNDLRPGRLESSTGLDDARTVEARKLKYDRPEKTKYKTSRNHPDPYSSFLESTVALGVQSTGYLGFSIFGIVTMARTLLLDSKYHQRRTIRFHLRVFGRSRGVG